MKNRILSLIVAVLFITACMFCFAEQPSPVIASPTQPEMILPEDVQADGQDASGYLQVKLSAIEDTPAADVLEQITQFTQAQPVFDFFGIEGASDEVVLPEDFDTNNLILAELWTVEVITDQELPAEAVVTYTFPAEYEDGTVLLGMVGIPGENGMEWTPVSAEAADGQVVLTFSQEVLQSILNNADAVFVLLQQSI